MTTAVKKAMVLMCKEFPGRIPTGYWIFDDVIVINNRNHIEPPGVLAPAQFAVTSDGLVFGTNPMQYDYTNETMTPIFKKSK